MIVDSLGELRNKTFVEQRKVLSAIIEILHYDKNDLPSEALERLEKLRDELIGNDFPSLMRRYVGMNLFLDRHDVESKGTSQTESKIAELAQQAIENIDLLQGELTWLVTTEAQNGYLFGYELGKRDKERSLISTLIEAQRRAVNNASVYFLGGYFRTIFEQDQPRWEGLLDILADDKTLNRGIPELTWRSGMSDRAALRILSLAERDTISVDSFRVFSLWKHPSRSC